MLFILCFSTHNVVYYNIFWNPFPFAVLNKKACAVQSFRLLIMMNIKKTDVQYYNYSNA